ncbi:hypothetical protein CAP35_00355 [Chitinophagaceae bacterium IBVUCB1]|nr:hypothetical protein CAP35_00355 [Chitinophagaceae bacterium IBVUCB1]
MLKHLKQNGMSTSGNRYDAIEQLIFEQNIRIEAIDFHKEQDVMIVLLNTKAVLRFAISTFKALSQASTQALQQYELIADGTGVHWPLLDEDLSLKGFLQEELKRNIAA